MLASGRVREALGIHGEHGAGPDTEMLEAVCERSSEHWGDFREASPSASRWNRALDKVASRSYFDVCVPSA